MARKRSRIDGMRMPFVVTMSVAASACGGTFIDSHRDNVETGGGGGDDPGSTGGTDPGTGGRSENGGAGGWSNGGSVSTGGWSYGGAIAAGGTVATGGMWAMGGSVNPPYPYPYMCPVEPPTSDAPCTGPYSPSGCAYPGNAPCMSTRTFSCNGGTWLESDAYDPTCNPPMPVPACPVDEPTQGQSCRGQFGGYYAGPDCGYGDCYGSPTSFWKCVPLYEGTAVIDYVWSTSGVASCNPPAPFPGAGGGPAADAGAAIPPNP